MQLGARRAWGASSRDTTSAKLRGRGLSAGAYPRRPPRENQIHQRKNEEEAEVNDYATPAHVDGKALASFQPRGYEGAKIILGVRIFTANNYANPKSLLSPSVRSCLIKKIKKKCYRLGWFIPAAEFSHCQSGNDGTLHDGQTGSSGKWR